MCCGVLNQGNRCRICSEAKEDDAEDAPHPLQKKQLPVKDPKRIYLKGGFSMLKRAKPITPYIKK
jgi:hypothetical protein